MLRSLLYYRHLNLAVILGVAVAGATLTGALMVGDSVRMSLRNLTYERLGNIHYAVMPQHLLDHQLADKLRDDATLKDQGLNVSQAMLLRGGASVGDARAARVGITGVDEHFSRFFPDDAVAGVGEALNKEQGQIFPSVIINERLALELGASVGDQAVLSFPKASAIHRDSLYGRKNTEDVVQQMRVTVRLILPDTHMGRFSLAPTQAPPFNAFVMLSDLQRAMGGRRGANSLLVGTNSDGDLETALEEAIARHITLRDMNLKLREDARYFALESDSFFFNDKMVEQLHEISANSNVDLLPLSTYLVNQMSMGDKYVPYSLMTGLDLDHSMVNTPVEGRFPQAKDETVINRWTADDLGLALGDSLTLRYFVVGPGEELIEDESNVRVVGILPMEGLGADQELTPTFPGAEDADDMGDWDPTFPMDMSLIRDEDEVYWDDYATSPKIFLTEELGKELWSSRFGYYTGFRFARKADDSLASLEKSLLEKITPTMAGLGVIPVQAQGVSASSGATDFTGLFIALSFFIIISACLLIGLFFRLLVVGRSGEAGLLQAVGYGFKNVRGRFLKEGLLLSAVGGLLGALGGMGYAALVMMGLRNFWDLGTNKLYFHLQPLSLVIGFVLTVVVAYFSVFMSVRVLRGFSLVGLISKVAAWETPGAAGRWRKIFWVAMVLTVILGGATIALPTNVGLGFGTGGSVFLAGIAGLAIFLRREGGASNPGGLWGMAARNTARQAGRSLVCVALVAMAVYTIVAVGLFRNAGEVDTDDLSSGAGGFYLMAEAEVPLHAPLERTERLEDLGLDLDTEALLTEMNAVSMRLRPGDDTSCLNLFAPRRPRILGLPNPEVFSGRFPWQSHEAEEGTDPWSLLEKPLEDGAIPVIGDFNSVMWIMRSGLGKTYYVENTYGERVPLRFVGLLKGSVFQSELIISEKHFQKLYPEASGYGYFLFQGKPGEREPLSVSMERDLANYGFDATETKARIQAFHAIENTYISIFQMLGGLGLLLGTLGLGAIIYRNALERKGELAAMRAFGFRQSRLAQMLVSENILLVTWGMGVGAISAVISMLPHVLSAGVETSWLLLIGTLVGVFITGMIATWWAVYKAGRFPLLASLRAG